MNSMENATVLGRSIKIRGELSGAEDLVLEGEFEGTLHLPGSRLTVGKEARLRASVAAKDVIVFGRVEGEIRATGIVELRSSGTMLGDVLAARLSMEEDAVLRGRVDPSRAAEPLPASKAPAGNTSAVITMTPRPATAEAAPTLFESQAQKPLATPGQFANMPAGLAAAARHFDAASTQATPGQSPTDDAPGNSSELAGSKAGS